MSGNRSRACSAVEPKTAIQCSRRPQSGNVAGGFDALVEDYIARYRDGHNAGLAFYRSQPSLAVAVEKAALAIRADGKRQSHQRRLSVAVLRSVSDRLIANLRPLAAAGDFERVLQIVDESAKSGFGALAIYDTALRVGSHLRLMPDRVYLHAGVKVGAKALGLDGRGGELVRQQLPPELDRLELHEVEDFLCIYKSEFRASVE